MREKERERRRQQAKEKQEGRPTHSDREPEFRVCQEMTEWRERDRGELNDLESEGMEEKRLKQSKTGETGA